MPAFNTWFPTSKYGSGAVNVADTQFGTFDGTGTNPMDANLAAANAYRIAQNKQVLIVPSGAIMKITVPFEFFDTANPTAGAISGAIVSEDPSGNTTNYGTKILATFDDDFAIKLSEGKRQVISGLRITNNVTRNHPMLRPITGGGIGLPGGGSGSSNTTIRSCWVDRFYHGVMTSYDFQDSQGEKTELNDFTCDVTAIPLRIEDSQNRGVEVYNSRLVGVTCALAHSNPVNIEGGGHGTTSGEHAPDTTGSNDCTLTIGTVTATVIGSSTQQLHWYEFSESAYIQVVFTITDATAYELAMLSIVGDPTNGVPAGAYQAMGIPTTNHGVVPMCPVSFNPGTGVMTAYVWPYWKASHYGSTNIATETNLLTELNAATSVYCSVWHSMFVGSGISVSGMHTESGGVLCTAMGQINTGGGGTNNRMSQCNFNYTVSNGDLASTRPARILQGQFPFFIKHDGTGDTILENNFCSNVEGSQIVIDLNSTSGTVRWSGMENFARPEPRERYLTGTNFNTTLWGRFASRALGAIVADRKFHRPYTQSNGAHWPIYGWMQSRHIGVRPHPAEIPTITAGLITRVGNYGSDTIGEFPTPWGGQYYKIQDILGTAPTNAFCAWEHIGITSGKDFDGAGGNWAQITFAAVGGSPCIVLDDGAQAGVLLSKVLEAGWALTLNNGSSDSIYLVTGYEKLTSSTYRVWICRASESAIPVFSKAAGSAASGNVKQQALSIKYYGAKI